MEKERKKERKNKERKNGRKEGKRKEGRKADTNTDIHRNTYTYIYHMTCTDPLTPSYIIWPAS